MTPAEQTLRDAARAAQDEYRPNGSWLANDWVIDFQRLANPSAVLALLDRIGRVEEALQYIAHLGSSPPLPMDSAPEPFYQWQLSDAIGTAARALSEPTASEETPQ